MIRIVMKFGGTSVADISCIHNVAHHVKREVENGYQVAVVVSAMAGTTNRLFSWTEEISKLYSLSEYDTVLSTGEQITSGLLAMALHKEGLKARSWLGWQIPIITNNEHTNARIIDIDSTNLIEGFKKNEIAVIAGFQGITSNGKITTLGRGGSDTSAVAIAAAIKADRCDIYTDVDGVYTTDPRLEPKACRLSKISFEDMLEMSSLGAKVLQVRSVEISMIYKVRTFVRSSFDDPISKKIENIQNPPGTLICDKEEILEKNIVTGIALSKDEAQISLSMFKDQLESPSMVFEILADHGINFDMILYHNSEDCLKTNLFFTVSSIDLDRSIQILENNKKNDFSDLKFKKNLSKVSIIGVGMRSYSRTFVFALKALSEKGIYIRSVIASEIKVSILLEEIYAELAVKTLHDIYNLNKS